MARLEEPALSELHKTDLALAMSAWDGQSSAGALRATRQLAHAMNGAAHSNDLEVQAHFLLAAAERLDARDAAAAADALLQSLKDAKDPNALADDLSSFSALAKSLSTVAPRLNAQDAARTANALVVRTQAAGLPHRELMRALSAVTARLNAQGAARLAPVIVRAFEDHGSYGAAALAPALPGVAAGLEPKDAARVATCLIEAMKIVRGRTGDPLLREPALESLGAGLSAVAVRLEAGDAARVVMPLIEVMTPQVSYPSQSEEAAFVCSRCWQSCSWSRRCSC
jgi:hypothetical protein